jgi:hypothetical protein
LLLDLPSHLLDLLRLELETTFSVEPVVVTCCILLLESKAMTSAPPSPPFRSRAASSAHSHIVLRFPSFVREPSSSRAGRASHRSARERRRAARPPRAFEPITRRRVGVRTRSAVRPARTEGFSEF